MGSIHILDSAANVNNAVNLPIVSLTYILIVQAKVANEQL